jgi:hypothetical protein
VKTRTGSAKRESLRERSWRSRCRYWTTLVHVAYGATGAACGATEGAGVALGAEEGTGPHMVL